MEQQSPEQTPQANDELEENSLEGSSTEPTNGTEGDSLDSQQDATGASDESAGTAAPLSPSNAPGGPPSPKKDSPLRRLLSRANIYLVVFICLLLVAGVIIAVAFTLNHRDTDSSVKTQALTKQALEQLANSDVSVGQPKQVLNVQSNAVFAGQVLVRSDLDVAGKLQVGGGLSLPDITVANTSVLGTTQVQKNLSVAGDTALQGQVSLQKSLSVTGGATFGGAVSVPQLSASSLQLNGDLAITHHIVSGGATPGRSNGGALGSGGSASVSGSDTAGTVNVNTGGGAATGCFVTVNFTARYNATPHVLVTPVGAAAGGFTFYVNRSSSSFSICAGSALPSSASFAFDYFVIG